MVAAALVLSAVISVLVTPQFARFAERIGMVVRPRDDRWHRAPTPLLGGAGIALAVLFTLALVLKPDPRTNVLLLGAALAFALGLIDDFRRLAPTTKLVGQVMVATVLVVGGVQVEIVEFPPAAFLLTVFWVVGMMNALNLIDNMDGLAAGVTVIAGAALAISAAPQGPAAALVAAGTAGAALGFLAHNFHPARVFMGDAGSLMLGFLLASAALLHTASSAANLGLALIGPLAVLALPIFDMTLVVASRRLAGRPISQGGRDHASHRLAALGLSDRGVVILLYAVASLLAAAGAVLSASSALLPLVALAVVVLVLFGIFLAEVDVYGWRRRSAVADQRPSRLVLREAAIYGRFGAEVALDVVLLTVAYYGSYLIRFEGFDQSAWMSLFVQSLPLVVGVQLATLVALRVYRTLWRYLGIADAVAIVRAITLGSAVAVLAVVIVFRFEGYSRAVFVMDWLFAGALLIGSRSFLIWLRHWFSMLPKAGERRVLIIGAGDSGALALRLLTASSEIAYRVVGFVDEDPGKRYRNLGGVPIVGTPAELGKVLDRVNPDLVVFAADRPSTHLKQDIDAACNDRGIEHRDLRVPV